MYTLKEIIVILGITFLLFTVFLVLALIKKDSYYMLCCLGLIIVIIKIVDILRFIIYSKRIMNLYNCTYETLEHVVDVYKISNYKDLCKLMEKDYSYLKKN